MGSEAEAAAGTDFGLHSCLASATAGDIQGWVLRYLRSGTWADPDLHDGLLLCERFWIGPLFVELERLERCCGPEEAMPFRVPEAAWRERVAAIAASLGRPESLPPLIVEWRNGHLSVRDGSHRHGAMALAGWRDAAVVVWCNSAADHRAALSALPPPLVRQDSPP